MHNHVKIQAEPQHLAALLALGSQGIALVMCMLLWAVFS